MRSARQSKSNTHRSTPNNEDAMMFSSANRMLDERSINHKSYRKKADVSRLMLERNMTMDGVDERYRSNRDMYDDDGKRIQIKKKVSFNFNKNNNIDEDSDLDSNSLDYGELTGQKFDSRHEIYDNGMPVRSSFQSRKPMFDQNTHLDFDLFDRDRDRSRSKKKKLHYAESGDGVYSSINESMKPILDETDPYETSIISINSTGCWLNDAIKSNKSIGSSGYALFNIMGLMYMLCDDSDDAISNAYKSYFTFQSKRKLNASLLTIREKLNNYRDQFVIDSYIISSNINELNEKTAFGLKKLAFVIIVNPDQPELECSRLNRIVSKVSNSVDVISSNTIRSIKSISLVNVSRIRPIFRYKIQSIVDSGFCFRDRCIRSKFLRFVGISCGYFEDRSIRLIEMPLKGDYVLGICMPKSTDDFGSKSKDNMEISLDIKKLSTCINYIQNRVFDEVLIPIIDKRFKIRLNKTLQNTGLKNIFTDLNYYKLFPDGSNVTDCIQYMDLVIGEYSQNQRSNNKNYNTECKFIANSMFEYYVRDIVTNTIIVMGKYVG